MPRVVLGGLVGGMLSIAGASYQGVFRNPLVDPYLLGVAAGAGLGATIALTMGRGVTAAGRSTRCRSPAFVMALVDRRRHLRRRFAAFGGLALGHDARAGRRSPWCRSLTAVQTFILQRHNEVIREVFQWVLGRLSGATWSDVLLIAPYVVDQLDRADPAPPPTRRVPHRRRRGGDARDVGVAVAAGHRGHRDARYRGGRVGERSDRLRRVGIPHVIRLVAGASYRRLCRCRYVRGAFLILADIPGRMLTNPAETPFGVVTAFIGAPFFIYLLRTRRVPV